MRIGIDLGGTSVKAALCADDGAILIKQGVPTKTGDPDGLRADMKQLALALCASGGVQPDEVESIGIGVPGSYDKPSCTLRFGTNLGMNDVCFAETFQPEFGCAVQLDNDANCAALGEATAGAGKNVKNMLMVTLGTGVGGGIIIDGKLYTGCNSLAGELGHIVIRQGGVLDDREESLVNISTRVKGESSLRENGPALNAKHICDAVDAGDALACELFETYCDDLACGLSSFINIFQPECIVLGGGLAGYGEKLLEPLRMLTFPQTFRGEDRNTEIVCASLGNDAGLVGAAMLAE